MFVDSQNCGSCNIYKWSRLLYQGRCLSCTSRARIEFLFFLCSQVQQDLQQHTGFHMAPKMHFWTCKCQPSQKAFYEAKVCSQELSSFKACQGGPWVYRKINTESRVKDSAKHLNLQNLQKMTSARTTTSTTAQLMLAIVWQMNPRSFISPYLHKFCKMCLLFMSSFVYEHMNISGKFLYPISVHSKILFTSHTSSCASLECVFYLDIALAVGSCLSLFCDLLFTTRNNHRVLQDLIFWLRKTPTRIDNVLYWAMMSVWAWGRLRATSITQAGHKASVHVFEHHYSWIFLLFRMQRCEEEGLCGSWSQCLTWSIGRPPEVSGWYHCCGESPCTNTVSLVLALTMKACLQFLKYGDLSIWMCIVAAIGLVTNLSYLTFTFCQLNCSIWGLHHVPEIRRNIMSVTWLMKKGESLGTLQWTLFVCYAVFAATSEIWLFCLRLWPVATFVCSHWSWQQITLDLDSYLFFEVGKLISTHEARGGAF